MARGRSELKEHLAWYHTSAVMSIIEVMHSVGKGGRRLDLFKWHPDHARRGGIKLDTDDPEQMSYFREAVETAARKAK